MSQGGWIAARNVLQENKLDTRKNKNASTALTPSRTSSAADESGAGDGSVRKSGSKDSIPSKSGSKESQSPPKSGSKGKETESPAKTESSKDDNAERGPKKASFGGGRWTGVRKILWLAVDDSKLKKAGASPVPPDGKNLNADDYYQKGPPLPGGIASDEEQDVGATDSYHLRAAGPSGASFTKSDFFRAEGEAKSQGVIDSTDSDDEVDFDAEQRKAKQRMAMARSPTRAESTTSLLPPVQKPSMKDAAQKVKGVMGFAKVFKTVKETSIVPVDHVGASPTASPSGVADQKRGEQNVDGGAAPTSKWNPKAFVRQFTSPGGLGDDHPNKGKHQMKKANTQGALAAELNDMVPPASDDAADRNIKGMSRSGTMSETRGTSMAGKMKGALSRMKTVGGFVTGGSKKSAAGTTPPSGRGTATNATALGTTSTAAGTAGVARSAPTGATDGPDGTTTTNEGNATVDLDAVAKKLGENPTTTLATNLLAEDFSDSYESVESSQLSGFEEFKDMTVENIMDIMNNYMQEDTSKEDTSKHSDPGAVEGDEVEDRDFKRGAGEDAQTQTPVPPEVERGEPDKDGRGAAVDKKDGGAAEAGEKKKLPGGEAPAFKGAGPKQALLQNPNKFRSYTKVHRGIKRRRCDVRRTRSGELFGASALAQEEIDAERQAEAGEEKKPKRVGSKKRLAKDKGEGTVTETGGGDAPATAKAKRKANKKPGRAITYNPDGEEAMPYDPDAPIAIKTGVRVEDDLYFKPLLLK